MLGLNFKVGCCDTSEQQGSQVRNNPATALYPTAASKAGVLWARVWAWVFFVPRESVYSGVPGRLYLGPVAEAFS